MQAALRALCQVTFPLPDEVAAVVDAHRVVAQDLEQLAARSGLGT